MKRHEHSFLDESLSNMKDNEKVKKHKQKEVEKRILSDIDQTKYRTDRKPKRWMKKLVPAFALLLAVGISATLFLNETGDNQQGKGGGENEQHSALEEENRDNDNDANDGNDDSDDEKDEMTELTATEKVLNHVEEHEDFEYDDVKAMPGKEEEGKFHVRVYEDHTEHIATLGWYLVDKETGEVEEKDQLDDDSSEANDKGIDKSEKGDLPENVTGGDLHQEGSEMEPEEAEESIEEHLELPDIHENTLIYNGTLSPDFEWRVLFPDKEDPEDFYLNDDGQFSIPTGANDLEPGDEIIFFVTAAEHIEASVRTVEIQPEEEGEEYIESSADASAVADAILEKTDVEWSNSEQEIALEVETTGDLESAPFYGLENAPIDEQKQLEEVDTKENTFKAHLSGSQEEDEDDMDTISPGDKVTVYLTGLGVTAEAETEVPEDLPALEKSDTNHSSEADDKANKDASDENKDTAEKASSDSNAAPDTSDTDTKSNVLLSPITWGAVAIIIVLIVIGIVIKKRKTSNEAKT